MEYRNDMFRAPEQFGLAKIARLEWGDQTMGFDLSAVWFDGTKFYLAEDAASWSHTPFDDYWAFGRPDLDEFDTADDLVAHFTRTRSGGKLKDGTTLTSAALDANIAALRLGVAGRHVLLAAAIAAQHKTHAHAS